MQVRRAGILGVVTIAAVVADTMAQAAGPTTYYFVEKQTCTVLVDFQKQRDEIERLSGDAHALRLIRGLVDEFAANGAKKCGVLDSIRMMAVYIPGVDNYGRPDFPNRVNVLRIDASAENLLAAARQDLKDLKSVPPALAITTFDRKR